MARCGPGLLRACAMRWSIQYVHRPRTQSNYIRRRRATVVKQTISRIGGRGEGDRSAGPSTGLDGPDMKDALYFRRTYPGQVAGFSGATMALPSRIMTRGPRPARTHRHTGRPAETGAGREVLRGTNSDPRNGSTWSWKSCPVLAGSRTSSGRPAAGHCLSLARPPLRAGVLQSATVHARTRVET